ncbi:MAG: hypothetical protein WDN31_16590 [Hyphomicrobium sp.]
MRGLLLDKIKATYNYWAIGSIVRSLWFGDERSVSGDRKTVRRFRERNWNPPNEFICSGLVQIGFVEAGAGVHQGGRAATIGTQRGGCSSARRRRGCPSARTGGNLDAETSKTTAVLFRKQNFDALQSVHARRPGGQRQAGVALLRQERHGAQSRQLRRGAQADRMIAAPALSGRAARCHGPSVAWGATLSGGGSSGMRCTTSPVRPPQPATHSHRIAIRRIVGRMRPTLVGAAPQSCAWRRRGASLGFGSICTMVGLPQPATQIVTNSLGWEASSDLTRGFVAGMPLLGSLGDLGDLAPRRQSHRRRRARALRRREGLRPPTRRL